MLKLHQIYPRYNFFPKACNFPDKGVQAIVEIWQKFRGEKYWWSHLSPFKVTRIDRLCLINLRLRQLTHIHITYMANHFTGKKGSHMENNEKEKWNTTSSWSTKPSISPLLISVLFDSVAMLLSELALQCILKPLGLTFFYQEDRAVP